MMLCRLLRTSVHTASACCYLQRASVHRCLVPLSTRPMGTAILSAGAGAVAAFAVTSPTSVCAGVSDPAPEDFLSLVMKGEYVTEFGVSGFCGYAAGFALKRAAQVAIFTTGCIFISMQVLANHGYVTVHWDKLEQDWKTNLDLNKDGKVDTDDVQSSYNKLTGMLEAGLPGAAGFGAGFILGLRS